MENNYSQAVSIYQDSWVRQIETDLNQFKYIANSLEDCEKIDNMKKELRKMAYKSVDRNKRLQEIKNRV